MIKMLVGHLEPYDLMLQPGQWGWVRVSDRGGGGLLYKKEGIGRRKFWKDSLRGIKTLLCGRGLEFFSLF